jgi:hypothetical protein
MVRTTCCRAKLPSVRGFLFCLFSRLFLLCKYILQVGKESSELNHELQALERQSASSDHCAELVSEALLLYDQASTQDMYQGNCWIEALNMWVITWLQCFDIFRKQVFVWGGPFQFSVVVLFAHSSHYCWQQSPLFWNRTLLSILFPISVSPPCMPKVLLLPTFYVNQSP